MAYGAAVKAGASVLGSSGGGGGGNQKNNTGMVGNLLGFQAGLNARDARQNRRIAREAAAQQRNDSLFNYGQASDAYRRAQDLAANGGQLASDYLTPGLLMAQDRNDIGGGSLETLLNLSQGYNPAVAANPYMNIFGADKRAMADVKRNAEAQTEQTLSGWEAAMADLGDEYTSAASDLGAERDRVRDEYTDRLAGDRAAEESREAEAIINAWIDSNHAAGARGAGTSGGGRRRRRRIIGGILGGVGFEGGAALGSTAGVSGNDENLPDFRDRRRGGRGKVIGADEGAKREYIQSRLAAGESYEDILNDPEFVGTYISQDRNAGPMYSSWRG